MSSTVSHMSSTVSHLEVSSTNMLGIVACPQSHRQPPYPPPSSIAPSQILWKVSPGALISLYIGRLCRAQLRRSTPRASMEVMVPSPPTSTIFPSIDLPQVYTSCPPRAHTSGIFSSHSTLASQYLGSCYPYCRPSFGYFRHTLSTSPT